MIRDFLIVLCENGFEEWAGVDWDLPGTTAIEGSEQWK